MKLDGGLETIHNDVPSVSQFKVELIQNHLESEFDSIHHQFVKILNPESIKFKKMNGGYQNTLMPNGNNVFRDFRLSYSVSC